MTITRHTKISDILDRYSDIAPAMEALGVRSVGSLGVRRKIARFINVAMAARIHRVPVADLIDTLNTAVKNQVIGSRHEAHPCNPNGPFEPDCSGR